MQRVRGVVQHYAWGDLSFIPQLLGLEPDGSPWAELWLGTHPNGPATLEDGSALAELTGPLPYLFKVLAAAEPLSLQTHPDADQALDGFRRGIYPDDGAKPELLCALTPFEAFCGFRAPAGTLDLLDELGIADGSLASVLRSHGTAGALDGLCRGRIDAVGVVEACASSDRPEATWVCELDRRYPGDPAVAVTVLLNHVRLRPGEAIRLDAGNLHVYLRGAGIELMGPSDNVVRAGLTRKPIDVEELLRVTDPTPLVDPVLPAAKRHELPDADIALVRLDPGEEHGATGHELALDVAGNAWYLAPGDRYTPDRVAYVVTR